MKAGLKHNYTYLDVRFDVEIRDVKVDVEVSCGIQVDELCVRASGSPSTVVPRPNFGAVILPNLIKSDNSGVMMALARTVPVLGRVSTKLWCRGPQSLLHSNSSVAVPALTGQNS
ncbi:Zinc finger CCCH-type with G patch domain-containing protein [Actinidia chinensis var. chinensis]|uniref:Zinc finger CCCH-type with G patch domain-containing protein n=1 Tax=Actinidia chinensis var. chinensis TaxID=1590841 RepID=A0A2R6QIE8_ACTCC|nr:Zinc finger CCCH-type with G patch domain-containing protein [Actinidia chinensis var. chinensis]